MKKFRLYVGAQYHKCTSSQGEWDGTWDDSYEYIIYDEEGLEVAGMDGFWTIDQPRETEYIHSDGYTRVYEDFVVEQLTIHNYEVQ